MASMSRKTYVTVAEILNDARHAGSSETATEEIAESLAWMFAQDNPRFDHDRFMNACGFGE